MLDVWRLLSFFGIGLIAFAVLANMDGIDVGHAVQSPSVTDWMQAVGTLGTFFIAIIVLQRWRKPEDAKRKADTAQELIRLSAQLEAAALASRSGGLTVLFEATDVTTDHKLEALKDLSNHTPRDAIERLSALRAELVAREIEIETLFGEPSAALMRAFLSNTEQIVRGYATLKYVAEPMDFVRRLDTFESTVERQMRVLGVRVITDANETADWEKDDFGNELKASGLSSRKALATFLVETPR